MTNRARRTVAVVCGATSIAFAIALGVAGADEPLSSAVSSTSSVLPAPPAPGGGAIPVQPAAGACIIGLNCGCIPHHTCPTPHARPGPTGANQHNAPAPQNP